LAWGSGIGNLSSPSPTIARSAGSSVMAASTAIATTSAAVYPSVVTSGMPTIASDSSATITVHPAKTTAPPELAVARAIDSRVSMPSRRCSMCRVTMNSA
jgi:hypothetical protein